MGSPPAWGIADLAFLTGFALTGLLLTVLSVILQNLAVARSLKGPEPHGYVLACFFPRSMFLSEVRNDLVVASLVLLRSRGLVETGGDGTLRPAGDGADLTDPLDRAVLRAVGEEGRLRKLKEHFLVRMEFFRLEEEYREWQDGRHRAHSAMLRGSLWTTCLLGLLLPLGVARLRAGGVNDVMPVFLLLILLLLIGADLFWLSERLRLWPDLQDEMDREKRAMMERRLQEARSRPRPDGAEYGVDELVLRTAYFGPADLADLDPEFAAVVEAEARLEAEEKAEAVARDKAQRAAAEKMDEARRAAAERAEARRAAERAEAEARRRISGSAGEGRISGGSSYGDLYEGLLSEDPSSSSGGCSGCGGGE